MGVHFKRKKLLFSILLFFSCATNSGKCDLSMLTHDLSLLIDTTGEVGTLIEGPLTENITITFEPQHKDIINVPEPIIIVSPGDLTNNTKVYYVAISAIGAGHSLLTPSIEPNDTISTNKAFVRVTVKKSSAIEEISNVLGWIYFVAWSISFYPQIFKNFRRKSVVGLNFDFLCLNIVGFFMYSLFNCGLYFVSTVEQEYFDRHPRGLNPVQVNDIVFALHATVATLITIAQCFIHERGDQRVSTTARVILGIFGLIFLISLILSSVDTLKWLDFLYICSYIKLTITLIKYVPQAFMNYKRKSTEGWSIENIFLDFTGGMLSMLQMILNSYNYDDWVSIFGDPTKFGLGLFSVVFDIFFIIQHYVLYRETQYEEIPGENAGIQALDNSVEPT